MLVFLLSRSLFFFFKQKTAYDMRISDWSSDVCSSDLFGVVMLIYLKHALAELGPDPDTAQAEAAVRDGALLRVRPKAMTVAVIFAGLLPILLGSGTGSEVMRRNAAPMIGGLLTVPTHSMPVMPADYLLLHRPKAQPVS